MRKLEQLIKRIREFGLLKDDEEKLSQEEFLQIEIHWTPKTQYIEFIEEFNKIRKTKYQPCIESRELFYMHEANFTNTERIIALKNALADPWIIENSFQITPKWILKNETLNKYLNYVAPTNNKSSNGASTTKKPPVA